MSFKFTSMGDLNKMFISCYLMTNKAVADLAGPFGALLKQRLCVSSSYRYIFDI